MSYDKIKPVEISRKDLPQQYNTSRKGIVFNMRHTFVAVAPTTGYNFDIFNQNAQVKLPYPCLLKSLAISFDFTPGGGGLRQTQNPQLASCSIFDYQGGIGDTINPGFSGSVANGATFNGAFPFYGDEKPFFMNGNDNHKDLEPMGLIFREFNISGNINKAYVATDQMSIYLTVIFRDIN